jgi:hypothetical protein
LSGVLLALYFLNAPAQELLGLEMERSLVAARVGEKYLRWYSRGVARVADQGVTLGTFSGPLKLVADYQDEGYLRILMEPNLADNAVIWGPEVLQIFVNGRKLSCRKEGDSRRLFYPILNNREPCER